VAAACIPDGASVLDVGCGTGGFLSHLREVRPHCRAQGVDISPRAVAVAVERGHDAFVADLVVDDIPGRYDVITCFETIEHIAEAEVVLQKIRDACDGTILMSLPTTGSGWRSSAGSRTRTSSSTSRSTSGTGPSPTSRCGPSGTASRSSGSKGSTAAASCPGVVSLACSRGS
jgi:2-polyprenyl-3-methyl-5-hydroxy-6-metoxy-1,4-benzoquinol methylase